MIDWLVKRLTPKKEKIERWKTLAETLQEIWTEFYDPSLQRLEDMRSSYSIDERDLIKKIKEYGDYFNYDIPRPKFRALDLGWRRLELDFKEQEFILNSALRRHFGGIFFEWLPIFAPIDLQTHPYGDGFVVSESSYIRGVDRNTPPLGYWLTSRGMLGVNLSDLYRLKIDRLSFVKTVLPIVSRTKPLHITFDGFCYFIKHDIDFPVFPVELEREIKKYLDISCFIESTVYLNEEQIERKYQFQYRASDALGWHLDCYLPDWLCDKENLPLDSLLYGIEGDDLSFYRILHVKETKIEINTSLCDSNNEKEVRRYFVPDSFSCSSNTYKDINIYQECEWSDYKTPTHLDKYVSFDAIPADFCSLDLPRAEYYE